MKLRQLLRLALATITVTAAGASLASGNFWMASGMVLCALASLALPHTKAVSESAVEALLESLRVARQAGAPAVKAVVGTRIIFIGKSAIAAEPVRGNALLFRDEIEVPAWRELATLLRHQSRCSPELNNVDRNAALRLGKTSDL